MRFFPEILTAAQQQALSEIGPLAAELGFHLAGGTALALLLGHRTSEDFDWFTLDALPEPLRLAREVEKRGVLLADESVARGTLHASLRGVSVSFLEFPYPLLNPAILWPEYRCSLLSLDDIACMKLLAISQRGARKDFVDLHALLTQHSPLAELLSLYRRKFDLEDVGHLLFSMAYFDDAEAEPMPRMLGDAGWAEIKGTIQAAVRELAS